MNFFDELRIGYLIAISKFKMRNEGSFLGILWYLLDPLLLFSILLLVRAQISSDNDFYFYATYLLIGILNLHFLRRSISTSLQVMRNHKGLIKNTNLSRFSLFMSNILFSIIIHVFEFLVLLIFLFGFGFLNSTIIIYLLVLLSFCITIIGIGFYAAIIGTFIKDSDNIWNPIALLLLFVTPIFYYLEPGSLLYYVNIINPLYHYLEVFRGAIFGTIVISTSFWVVLILPLFLIYTGFILFKKYQLRLAEIL